ncbi:YbaB/EbfC family nucleoid-associated protein [Actinophytocola sp. NPDC049390]|uniref:YbaB/EbfC family nucleoid-associated protein n=1 Tax=Actinophytocola sp. NPDC049390 TaxID=3363894 RepID=UPI0037BC9135
MAPRPRVGPTVDHDRMRAGLLAVRERLADVRETAESDDGLITVTVGARTELLDLRLDPRVLRSPNSTALAADILATTRRAAERVRTRLYELTRSLLADPGSVHR